MSSHTVHLRVNDETGQPTPARVRFVASDGKYLAPFGRLAEFATEYGQHVGGNLELGARKFAYIDGGCEIRLPDDPFTIEIAKGPEYRRILEKTAVGPGKIALRYALERWIDLRQERWHSGDTRCHFLTPHGALLEGMAEDLAVVNLLALETAGRRRTIDNILAFSGPAAALQAPGHLVAVGTLNYHPVLGRLGLLHCHRVVYPLSFGGATGDNWTLADWCDQCHRKAGLVVWPVGGDLSSPESHAGEALADLVLGKVDALEVDSLDWCRQGHDIWYRLLNCGFRVPLAGGSGKASNAMLLGGVRTYGRLLPGEELGSKTWIEAVRAGRTFATNSPLLTLTINDQDPGSKIDLSGPEPKVRIRAEARSLTPFERLEIVHNGAALAGVEASGSPCSAVLEGELAVPSGGWLAARCWGSAEVATGLATQRVGAHTSPAYLDVADRPFSPDPFSLAIFTEHMDRMLAWVEKEARCEGEKQKNDLLHVFQAARQELVKRMGGGGQET